MQVGKSDLHVNSLYDVCLKGSLCITGLYVHTYIYLVDCVKYVFKL